MGVSCHLPAKLPRQEISLSFWTQGAPKPSRKRETWPPKPRSVTGRRHTLVTPSGGSNSDSRGHLEPSASTVPQHRTPFALVAQVKKLERKRSRAPSAQVDRAGSSQNTVRLRSGTYSSYSTESFGGGKVVSHVVLQEGTPLICPCVSSPQQRKAPFPHSAQPPSRPWRTQIRRAPRRNPTSLTDPTEPPPPMDLQQKTRPSSSETHSLRKRRLTGGPL